jgi:hypothetical protein
MHRPFCSDAFSTFDATGVDFVWITFRDSDTMRLIDRRAWSRHDYCNMVFKKLEEVVYNPIQIGSVE